MLFSPSPRNACRTRRRPRRRKHGLVLQERAGIEDALDQQRADEASLAASLSAESFLSRRGPFSRSEIFRQQDFLISILRSSTFPASMSFPASGWRRFPGRPCLFGSVLPSNALSWLVRASMSLRRPADSALTAEILFTRSGTLYAIPHRLRQPTRGSRPSPPHGRFRRLEFHGILLGSG